MNNELYLFGHVSAANPQAQGFNQGKVAALAIFSAGHSYVSSSWYEQENVSTWNYRSVQVKGNGLAEVIKLANAFSFIN